MAGKFDMPASEDPNEIIDVDFRKVENEDEVIDAEIVEPEKLGELKAQKAIEKRERKGLPAPEAKVDAPAKVEKSAEVLDKRSLEREIDDKKAEKRRLEQELEDLRGQIDLLKKENEQLFKDATEVSDALSYMGSTNPVVGMFDLNYRKAKAVVKEILTKPKYRYYQKNPQELVEKSKQAKSEIYRLEAELEEKDRDYKWRGIDLTTDIRKSEQKLS